MGGMGVRRYERGVKYVCGAMGYIGNLESDGTYLSAYGECVVHV